MPWTFALRNWNVWAIVAICFCYLYTYSFFTSWFHTYLVKARGFRESDLSLSALPFVVAALANFVGGCVSNILVLRIGLRWDAVPSERRASSSPVVPSRESCWPTVLPPPSYS